MSEFVAFVVTSVFLGAALGMMALSFSIGYTASRVFNFAVGQFMLLGGLLTVAVRFTPNALLNDLIAFVIVTVAGGATYVLALRWPETHRATPLTLVIITFGLGIVVEQVTEAVWGSYALSPPLLLTGHFTVDGTQIPFQGLLFVAVSAVAIGGLALIQHRTIIGRQLLAVGGTDRLSAQYFGVPDFIIVTAAWMLAFAALGIVGTLYLPLTGVSMSSDLTYGIDAFAAAIVGGLGSSSGAIIGGGLLAFAINGFGIYVSPDAGDLIAFLVLFAFLVFRPAGVTGRIGELLGPRA